MRLPLTLSELFVVQSGARIIVQAGGVLLLLVGLWGLTVLIERELEAPEEEEPARQRDSLLSSLPQISDAVDEYGNLTLPIEGPAFPLQSEIHHKDGRSLDVFLLSRPTRSEITFQRVHDERVFTMDIDELAPATQDLVETFPAPRFSNELLRLTRQVFPSMELYESLSEGGLQFPHDCLLVSADGRTLKVTLLSRPSSSELTFRRRRDGETFTIALQRLSPSDRRFIQQFPIDFSP